MALRSPMALLFLIPFRCAVALLLLGLAFVPTVPAADDPNPASKPASETDTEETDIFELSAAVQNSLFPLFKSIAEADVSRATVELVAETIAGGEVVDARTSTYQIASRSPNMFTVYLKEPEQRTRIYSDGEKVSVALSPEAYFEIDQPISIADAVDDLPVPMGP